MRATLILFVMACLPAFSQEDGKPFIAEPSPGLVQRLREINRQPVLALDGRTLSSGQVSTTCAIPLLNATPPGKPVDMPKLTPPKSGATDRMQVAPPAPACAASFGHIGAPAPALPPPTPPPPPPTKPTKP